MKQTMFKKNKPKSSLNNDKDEDNNLFKRDRYIRLSASIRKLSKYYRDIFQKNNIAMLIINSDNGDIVNANLVACKFYGYTKNEFKKLKITQIGSVSEKEMIKKLQQSLKRHFLKFQFKHYLSNKETRDVEVHSGPLKILGKKFVYFIVEDITERVRLEKELKNSEIQYKQLFNNANDAIFFGEANEDGTPKFFIDVNEKACKLLKYSRDEILNKSPLDICFFKDYERKPANYCVNNITKKRATFETRIRAKDGGYLEAEISVHVFNLNDKRVFLTIARDVTERKLAEEEMFHNSKLLEGVLEGITDIIGVCDPDNNVVLYNQAGHEFFNITPKEINDKKCYEILHRKERCDNCPIEKIIATDETIRMEKYIPSLDKYLDCCCNPILDDSGKVIYVINQLRDITEKKNMENVLKESEERYRQIVNLLPDAMLITVQGKIVLANQKALKRFDNLIGERPSKFIPEYSKIINKRIKQIIGNKTEKAIFDYKIPIDDNRIIDAEVSSSYLNYQGKPAVLSIIRNVTKKKNELNSAARMQKELFKKPFSITDKAKLETVYVPAKTVSGDFFYIKKINEDTLIGLIGDVSGKGITAALKISAFNVLFHEAILSSEEPFEILNTLNRKVGNYLGDRYVAACCFKFDFKRSEAKIVGAGINQFIFQNSLGSCERKIVKGPFLGMFENSIFDEEVVQFDSGARFYFFTDGLDFVFEDDKMNDFMLKTPVISNFTSELRNALNEMLTDVDGIQDDCTLITMEIQ